MDIVRVDVEGGFTRSRRTARRRGEGSHPIKVHQEGKKDIVGGGTVLEDPQQIGLEGDGGHVPGMESQRGIGRRRDKHRLRSR